MIQILKVLLKVNPKYYDSIYEYIKDVYESTKQKKYSLKQARKELQK